MEKNKKKGISRRKFIGNVSLATAGITFLPGHVIGGLGHLAPSDKLNIAGIGVGGMGGANINNCNSQNIGYSIILDISTGKTVTHKVPSGTEMKALLADGEMDITAK